MLPSLMNDLRLTVNGEIRNAPAGATVATLLAAMGVDPARVAVEKNRNVVPRRTWTDAPLADGDKIEIVAFIGGGSGGGPAAGSAPGSSSPAAQAATAANDALVIGGKVFHSRLLVGTGKYRSIEEGREAILRSGAEIVTVALRRVELTPGKPSVLDTVDRSRHTLLPNTAGCYTAEEAIRTCGLARRLEDAGCAAVMPLAAPIGSGLGIRNPYNIRIILEHAKVPVIVDAGVGTASDAAVAMELGCHGVLMNTAIAGARDPVMMAEAMRDAVIAGRKAFRAGRIPRKLYANASSPLEGLIE